MYMYTCISTQTHTFNTHIQKHIHARCGDTPLLSGLGRLKHEDLNSRPDRHTVNLSHKTKIPKTTEYSHYLCVSYLDC